MTLLNLDPDQLLSTTRAVRKRLDFSRPVPDQLIRECVAMALQAPSGSNVVTMRFVVVRDEKKRQAVGEIYRQVYAQYKASASYPGNPTGEPERDGVQRRVASSADYLGEHMGDAPVLVLGCNEGRDRASALAGLGNILPAMWSFMRGRELHDSLTHSISVIQVQAGVAVHLARKRGEDIPPALLAIQEAGADATRELRATLSVLRSQDHYGEDCDGSGLGQLDSLVARARSAGLPVSVTVNGARRPLPPDVDQAAYRIVQEALTNVSRHAGHACASVHLNYAPDALTVQVNDDGKGVSTMSAGPGLGLVGMRERVSAPGGWLHRAPGGRRLQCATPVPGAGRLRRQGRSSASVPARSGRRPGGARPPTGGRR